MVHGRTLRIFLCVLAVAATARPAALVAQDEPSVAELEAVYPLRQPRNKIRIVEKFSKILQTDAKILRVDGFDPDVISVKALAADQLRIQALKPGVTSMSVVDEHNQVFSIEFFVTGDVRYLQAHIAQMFPNSSVECVELGDGVVLRGWVTQPESITEIVEIAQQFYKTVMNHMRVGGEQQVMLKVKILEVQRSKIRTFGFNFIQTSHSGFIASTPGQLTPIAGLGKTNTSFVGGAPKQAPTIAFGLINPHSVFNGFLEALKEENLLKVRAEPVLVTTNGRPATILNGGQFPILTPSGLGTTTVKFREFGVSMEACPQILGNGRLRLELSPEVSERDFANAIQLAGTTVPALTTRRVNTQVEMKFGQTLMIAGLISKEDNGVTSKLPILGEIPWLGLGFSKKRYEEKETELVIMVTPEYVAGMSADEPIPAGPGFSTSPPTDRDLFIDGLIEIPKYGNRCQNCQDLSPIMPGPGSPMYGPTLMQDPGSSMYGAPQMAFPPAPQMQPPPANEGTENAPIDPQTRRSPARSRFGRPALNSGSEGGSLQPASYQSSPPQTSRSGRGWVPRSSGSLIGPTR